MLTERGQLEPRGWCVEPDRVEVQVVREIGQGLAERGSRRAGWVSDGQPRALQGARFAPIWERGESLFGSLLLVLGHSPNPARTGDQIGSRCSLTAMARQSNA